MGKTGSKATFVVGRRLPVSLLLQILIKKNKKVMFKKTRLNDMLNKSRQTNEVKKLLEQSIFEGNKALNSIKLVEDCCEKITEINELIEQNDDPEYDFLLKIDKDLYEHTIDSCIKEQEKELKEFLKLSSKIEKQVISYSNFTIALPHFLFNAIDKDIKIS